MREAFAVTGFVPTKVATSIKAGQGATIQVHPERGEDDVWMQVQGRDIEEVRQGASSKGQTLVQLILRDGAVVETIVRSNANETGINRFADPTLRRLTAAATAKKIVV